MTLKIACFSNLKGGVGKSTCTLNIASVLSEKSKVLLLDVDPQANLSNDCGIDITNTDYYSAKDIFCNDRKKPPVADLIIKSPIEALPNMDIIPSNIYLHESELNLYANASRLKVLRNYMLDNKDEFLKYDYILVDTSPSMSIAVQASLYVADSIILVSDVDNRSLLGIRAFSYLWGRVCEDDGIDNNINAIIFNKSDKRTTLTKDLWDYYTGDEDLSKLIVNPPISDRIAFKRASLQKLPVTLYKDGKESAEEIRMLVKNMIERGVL